MPPWWEWAFWLDPFSYAVQGLIASEFSAPRWGVPYSAFSSKRHRITLGQTCLNVCDLPACQCPREKPRPACRCMGSMPSCMHGGLKACMECMQEKGHADEE